MHPGSALSTRRAALHERLAAGLSRVYGDDPARAAELALHFVEAVRLGADGAVATGAVLHSVRAGEWALTRLGYEQAAARFTDALDVVDTAGSASPAERTRLLVALGGALWRAGDVPRAQAAFVEAATVARAAGEVELLAEAVIGIGGGPYRSWHAARGDLSDLVVDHLVRALVGIGDDDSSVRVRLLGCLAEALYYVDPARRWSLSAEALAMARRLDDPISLASALSSRLLCVWDPSGLDERLALCPEIIALASVMGDQQLGLFGRRHGAVALLEAGEIGAAAEMLDAFSTLAEDIRQPLHLWEAMWLRAVVVLLQGRLDEAEALATAALHRGQGTRDDDALGIYGALVAIIRSEQGRLVELEDAMRSFAQDFPDIMAWRVGWVGTLAELGRHAEARIEMDTLAAEGFADLPTTSFTSAHW
ncbi:hypothetical protein BH18ACT1_BH18ACT1_09740 [soil metagenome]